MEAELKLQRRPRMRSIMARTPFERCGGRCCSRPSARKAPRLPRPNGRERWPRYLARLVDHLRSFSPLARSLDRLGVFVISGVAKWPSAFPRTYLRRLGLPALLQKNRTTCLAPSCSRKRSIDSGHVAGVLCDIDCEDMDLFHTPVMRRRRLHGLGPAHCGSDQALRTLESARA